MTAYASRTGPRPSESGYVRGTQKNGYRYGPGRFKESASFPETNRAIRVEWERSVEHGYELLDGDHASVAWFACPVDACDLRRWRTERGLASKIVRCADRALITSWTPPRRGDS